MNFFSPKIIFFSLFLIAVSINLSETAFSADFGHSRDQFRDELITKFGFGNRITDLGDKILLQFKRNGKYYLSLADCIEIALNRNLDIHLISESLAQADADMTRAWSAMLPFIGIESSYTQLDKDLTFDLGGLSMTIMERNIYKAGFVVKQPIYFGGKLNAARKATRYSRDACIYDKQSVEKEIVFNITKIYRTVQVSKAFYNVAVEAVDLLEQHKRDVEILTREGAIAEVNLLRTKTELANAVKDLHIASNAYDIAISTLKNLLVIDLEEPILLIGVLEHPPKPAENLAIFTGKAIKNRSELASQKLKVEAAEQGLKAARGKYYPNIAMEGRYEYIEGDTREMDGDFHWTIGIGAQVPIWNWGKTRADIIKAGSQLNQAKIAYKKLEEQICLEVHKAFLNLTKADKNIAAAKAALKTSKEAYRLEKAGYQSGINTNTDVLEARTALSRAEANHVQALFEYNITLAMLERAIGNTVTQNINEDKKEQVK